MHRKENLEGSENYHHNHYKKTTMRTHRSTYRTRMVSTKAERLVPELTQGR